MLTFELPQRAVSSVVDRLVDLSRTRAAQAAPEGEREREPHPARARAMCQLCLLSLARAGRSSARTELRTSRDSTKTGVDE
jgi:hypothetical protein